MSFLRVRTIKGKQYLYRQTSVRKGKKVLSIMEYLGALIAIGAAAASPGKPGGYSGSRSTDKRAIKHQEEYDRERFAKDRAGFNAKQRGDYQREQKACEYAKAAREAHMSRAEKQERATAKADSEKKAAETMEAVREFNEARKAEKAEPSSRKI